MNKKTIAALFLAVYMTTMINFTRAGAEETDISRLQNKFGGQYNIIFITTDQERYFDEFPAGTDYKARERLKELGTSFEKNYICANVSSASRSVIYTGRHITETQIHDNLDFPLLQTPLCEDLKTTGDMMRELGYYTAFKGKCHFIEPEMEGNMLNPIAPSSDGSEKSEKKQAQDVLEPYGFSDWNAEGDYAGEPAEGYEKDPIIAADSVSWLRSAGTKLNKEGVPFFLAVNFVNPHDIMYANVDLEGVDTRENAETDFMLTKPPKNGIYEKTYPLAPLPASNGLFHDKTKLPGNYSEYLKVDEGLFGPPPETAEEWRRFQDYYYNCIQDSDNNMMTVLDEIERLGMLENTIIVFTADHGDMQGAHNMREKMGNIYENNVHVPLVIVHPDFQGDRRVTSVTSLLDLAPTFVDFSSASAQEKEKALAGVKGRSLLPLLENPEGSVRSGALFLFSSLTFTDADSETTVTVDPDDGERQVVFKMDTSKRGMVRGIIEERYKFARYSSPDNFNMPVTFEELFANNDVELYDTLNDPDEMINLAAEPQKNKALIMTMNNKLNKLILQEVGKDDGKEFRDIPAPGGIPALKKDVQ